MDMNELLQELQDFYDELLDELIEMKVSIQDRERKMDDNYKIYALGLTPKETAKLLVNEIDEEKIAAWRAEEQAKNISESDERDYQDWRKE